MSEPPEADTAARERSLDPRASFIVQAPAGSGKTELLTRRYLVLLSGVEAPEQVVAITFTRKAAAEMRNRILGSLEASRGDPPAEPHARRGWEIARAALERSSRLGWDLEATPSRLRVQTLDSLCAFLARQMPLLSEFGAPPEVTEQASAFYEEAAWRTLADVEAGEGWSSAVEILLRRLDNDWSRVAGLLSSMLARRDQWLRHLGGGASLSRSELEQALVSLIEHALAEAKQCFPRGSASSLLQAAGFAARHVDPGTPIAACAGLAQLPGTTVPELEQWLGLAELLLTRSGDWRAQLNRSVGFPAANAAKDPREKARLSAEKESAAKLLESLRADERLRDSLHALRALPQPRYGEADWAALEALGELLTVAVGHLMLVFQEHGAVDFIEVARRARRALGPSDDPTDLALALDYRIQHILMDEFQDTSLTQFALLESLTAGWQAGDGRTLFLVGDPMQSIYRFREAEVGLFLQARLQGIGAVTLTPLTLSANFRSQAGLVEWANQTFAGVMGDVQDAATGAVPYSPSRATRQRRPGPAVHVHALLEDDAQEAALVVRAIREAQRDFPAGSAAVLVRSRSHLPGIVQALKAAGLRFRALEIEALSSRGVVQDLLALSRAVLHLGDRLAWLSVLRAPWCGLTLADLQVLAADRGRTLWDRLQDPSCREALSLDGRRRISRLAGVMGGVLAERGRATLARRVEGAWLALGGPACIASPGDLDHAEVYLDRLAQRGAALTEPAALDDLVAGLYAPPDREADERLQVMTVHKAKGLEFDTVLLPGLGRGVRGEGQQLLLWWEAAGAAPQRGLVLAPIAEAGQQPGKLYRYLRERLRREDTHETSRLLYVATTRARERLHLFGKAGLSEDGSPKAPGKATFLDLLWPVVREVYEQAARARPPGEGAQLDAVQSAPTAHSLRRLPADWRRPHAPAGVALPAVAPSAVLDRSLEFDWAGEAARHVGTLVHRYLQRVGLEGLDAWDEGRIAREAAAIRAALRQLGVHASELEGAAARVRAILSRVLADDKGRWVLSPHHHDIRTEYALAGVLDGEVRHAVLDRTFVDGEGMRWIIDYKSGSHEGGGAPEFLDREVERYRAQLEVYGALMARREPRPIRLGLYFPQLGGWREWAFPPS